MTDSTLFVGGRVLTGRGHAEGLLVENGRVVATGAESAVRALAATGTDRVDLNHGLVVPGLVDAHLHLGELVRVRGSFDAGSARSVVELLARLGAWAGGHRTGPVLGRGVDLESLAERRWPTLAELDGVAADRPLVLLHASGHAAALNSAALDRSFPSGSRPGTHLLLEDQLTAVRALVEEAAPVGPDDLEALLYELSRLGLTSVGTMSTGPEELRSLQELDAAGRLPVRVAAFPPSALAAKLPTPSSEANAGHFRLAGVKIFLDGAFGTRTAALTDPYADDPSTVGVERGTDDALRSEIAEARRRGLVPALHAIGDRAVARAAHLLSETPGPSSFGRIEHAGLTPPSLFPLLRALGAPVVVQPGFLWSDHWLAARLGAARGRWAYAFRSLLDQSVPLAGSSDAPYDPVDPWRAMNAARHRRDPVGRSANPSSDQALTAEESLALYTTGAGRALIRDGSGALVPGAPADFVLLDGRRWTDALDAGRGSVRETWVAGATVYRRAASP